MRFEAAWRVIRHQNETFQVVRPAGESRGSLALSADAPGTRAEARALHFQSKICVPAP